MVIDREMPKPKHKRVQTDQINVRLKPEERAKLEEAVEKLRAGGVPGARYSISGLLLDAGLAEAERILSSKK